jgi:hypothetical protein
MSSYRLSKSNKVYLSCVVGVYILLFLFSPASTGKDGIPGHALGILALPTLVSWGVWRLGKSNKGASIAFNIVLTLNVLIRLFAVGEQVVATSNHQVMVEKKEAYYLSLSQSGLAESKDLYDAYTKAARTYYSGIAETQSGVNRKSIEIFAELMIELVVKERNWLGAREDIRSQRIMDMSRFNNTNELEFQKTKIGNYIWLSKNYKESASDFAPELGRRFSEINYDIESKSDLGVEWGLGLRNRLDSLATSLQTHVELGETMMSIVSLLERNNGQWEIRNDEILMSSDNALSEYGYLAARLDSLAREIDYAK